MSFNNLDDVDSDSDIDNIYFNKRYSKFYDLTFLYPGEYEYHHSIRDEYAKEYFTIIKDYIKNNNEFKDGDIIFIGSTYESRQYYGFATIIGDRYIQHENLIDEYFRNIPGVYYKHCINEINIFWSKNFKFDNFFGPYEIEESIKNGCYDFYLKLIFL